MENLLNLLREAGQAAVGLFTLPYFYIAIVLVGLHASFGVKLQRKLYHVRLYGTLYVLLTRLLAGVVLGAVISLLSFGIGAEFSLETLLFLWVTMGILTLFRLRYICMAYAAGLLVFLQLLLDWTGQAKEEWLSAIVAINAPALLLLAGLLQIGEGLLVRIQGSKLSIPLYLQGKRGKPLGAYSLSGIWPIPILWLIPAASGGFELPWTPLFGRGGEILSWTMMAFPMLIGFSDRTIAMWPEEKARQSGNLIILYGVMITALAVGSHYWSPLILVTALAAFVLHEVLMAISRWREIGQELRYSHDGTGVKVLGVLPHTPAVEMGLQSGEVIKKVNGFAVRNKRQLHAALEKQSAYCKLEVVNREGHIKFVQRARYADEHYQLGIILAPEEDIEFVAAPRSASIWQGLREAGVRRTQFSPTMRARRELELAEAELAAAAAVAEEQEASRAKEAAAALGLPPRFNKK